jgi:tetratricopeptide (TPR) repeat protein
MLGVLSIVAATFCLPAQPKHSFSDAHLKKILSQARVEAGKIKDESARLDFLVDLAASEAEVGNIEFALSEAERLEPLEKEVKHYSNCDSIYQVVSFAQIRAGDIDGAIRTVQRMENKISPVYALVGELAKNGYIDRALDLIATELGQPYFPRDKPQMLQELAVVTAQTGNSLRAHELFDRAEASAADLLQTAGARPGVFDLSLNIATSRRLCGDQESANRMFLESRQVALAVKDSSLQQQFLEELAAAAAKGGGFDLARQVFHQISNPGRKSQAGEEIVRAYLDNENYDTDAAVEVTSEILDFEERVMALTNVASMQARKGDKAAAQKTIALCLGLLKSVTYEWKTWRLTGLGSVEYELGDREQAAQLLEQAIASADRLPNVPDNLRSMSLTEISRIQGEFGNEAAALRTARMTNNTSDFAELARTEAEKGNANSALKWIANLKDPVQKGSSLLAVISGILDAREDLREHKSNANPHCK